MSMVAHALGPVVDGHVDSAQVEVRFTKSDLLLTVSLEFIHPRKKNPLAHFRTPPVFRQRVPLARLRREAQRWHAAVDTKMDASGSEPLPPVEGL